MKDSYFTLPKNKLEIILSKNKKKPPKIHKKSQNKHKTKCITFLLHTKMKYFYGSKRF